MSREIDPKNLSFGDVVRAIAPLVIVITIFVIVGRYAPDYFLLAVVAIIGFGFYWIYTLPKKDIEAIVEADRKVDSKIQKFPIIGPVAGPVWRAFNWLMSILSVVLLIWLIYLAIKNVL